MLTILFLGDVVGEPGRSAVIARLAELKEKYAADFVVVNGENAAGGRGITGKITIDLLRAGVSVVTTGDHIWDQKDIFGYIDTEPRLLRPVNYPDLDALREFIGDDMKGAQRLLREQVDMEPAASTKALLQQVMRGDLRAAAAIDPPSLAPAALEVLAKPLSYPM